MNTLFIIVLIIAVAVGVFLFVKNNPNKSQAIADAATKAAKDAEQKIKDKIK